MEFDILGDQLLLAIRFVESGFDCDAEFKDAVNQEKVKGSSLFTRQGNVWYMNSESIPGYLAIKAIGVDKSNLYLETSPLDAKRTEEVIKDNMLPFAYDSKRKVFSDLTTHKALIHISAWGRPQEDEITLGARCLWRIPFRSLDSIRREAAVRLADSIYTAEAFEVESIEEAEIPAPTGRIGLRLQLRLQQSLRLEQRPILLLGQTIKGAQRHEQRLELRQIMGLQQLILNLKPEELIDFFAKYIEEHSEKRAIQVVDFILAGKIKRLRPNLTWKQARAHARRLTPHL